MKNIKSVLLLLALLIFFPSFSQKFVVQETNLDKKKISQYLSAARRCRAALLKEQNIGSLPFSSNSSLTNNSLNALSDRFINLFPKGLKPSEADGQVVERALLPQKEQVIKLTYGFLPLDKKATTDFIQLTVSFDPGSAQPKITNIQVKGKDHIGILTFTERELLKLRKPPASTKPVAKKSPTVKKTK